MGQGASLGRDGAMLQYVEKRCCCSENELLPKDHAVWVSVAQDGEFYATVSHAPSQLQARICSFPLRRSISDGCASDWSAEVASPAPKGLTQRPACVPQLRLPGFSDASTPSNGSGGSGPNAAAATAAAAAVDAAAASEGGVLGCPEALRPPPALGAIVVPQALLVEEPHERCSFRGSASGPPEAALCHRAASPRDWADDDDVDEDVAVGHPERSPQLRCCLEDEEVEWGETSPL
mmetsp:Transcript_106111/g.269454  ORF Transcript_106111/g.269454 Transcript_106111/m.269454 type:complete len:235 (-) Transcript_106111:116-820(-)